MAEKSAAAFRTISEVSDIVDLPAHVLRFWETRFTQLRPIKRGGGRRYYRPEDVYLIKGLRQLLHVDGLTIKGAQKVLREKGIRHVAALGLDEEELAAMAERELPAGEAPFHDDRQSEMEDVTALVDEPEHEEPADMGSPVPQPAGERTIASVTADLIALRDRMQAAMDADG